MPKLKREEKELEIDTSKQKKPITFVKRWFQDHAVNNKEDIKIICDLTAKSAAEQFYFYIKTDNTEVFAVIFYATFTSILEFIKGKQKTYNNFTITIANSINVGYSNNDDENNEKVGNFMPIMEHIGINRNIVDDSSKIDADRTSRNFITWKTLNIKKTSEYYKEIQEMAYDKLKREFKTSIRTSEAVFPLFCIFMDHLVNYMKYKYREAERTEVSEVSMNVLGLFDIYYSFDEEENLEIIEFQPNILMKLTLKSDAIASRE